VSGVCGWEGGRNFHLMTSEAAMTPVQRYGEQQKSLSTTPRVKSVSWWG